MPNTMLALKKSTCTIKLLPLRIGTILYTALLIANPASSLADIKGNGAYACPDGHILRVSGYRGWSGNVKVTYKGKSHILPNYYKFGFGKSPDSPAGYIDILDDGVLFKISGYLVCESYRKV